MLSEEQEKKVREIAKDVVERAFNGEFGWVYGINGDIPWDELQEIIKNAPPAFHFVDGVYVPIEED